MAAYNMLILGASYGSLLATKLLLAGHNVTLVCLPEEADLINAEGTIVRLPVKGESEPVVLESKKLPGKLTAVTPDMADPTEFDLVGLAMQEPQYRHPSVRALLDKIGGNKVPCMSIMNMPPLPYLRRIPEVDGPELAECFTDASVWDSFGPEHMTLCSPDPQAFRPPDEKLNVLQVTLPTNFKAARFDAEEPTEILRRMQADIEAVRYEVGGREVELPVKLKVHDSIFVPLAKWAMLISGNYRCVTPNGIRTVQEAVHGDMRESKEVYDWVRELCMSLGASADDLVPFEKYAAAAQGLVRPSSAARALYAGAPNIERVDRLVQLLGRKKGMSHPVLDEIVQLVDAQLQVNREAAAA